MRAMIRVGSILAAAALLSACPKAVRPPAPPRAEQPVGVPSVPRDATVYGLDAQACVVYIQVYRGGSLARLGHNHVMTARGLSGRIWLAADIGRSGFEFTLPVSELAVDEPQARQQAGDEFPGEIAQADRDGTRRNMLREEVLDAEHHPNIKLTSVRMTGTREAPKAVVRITIKGVSRDIEVAGKAAVTNDGVTVSGEFDILQTHFGIKPFSVALGALEVQDRLHIRFRMVGVRK